MNQKWIRHNTAESCPTCTDLAGQVHPAETWGEKEISPRAECLYCGGACRCTLEPTDEPESGKLESVRYKEQESATDRRLNAVGPTPLALTAYAAISANPKGPTMPEKKFPLIFSDPVLAELQIKLPTGKTRAETLAMIQNGELEYIDFDARVYRHVQNTNYYTFPDDSLADFAASFAGQPYLRDHDTHSIASRDGTILKSELNGDAFDQTIRLTTRQGMTSYIEGQIDRFSIGWYYDDMLCSICNTDIFSCSHFPGNKYKMADGKEATCQIVFTNPKGKETSAVNAPGVIGETGLLAALSTHKGVKAMPEPTTGGQTSAPPTSTEAQIAANLQAAETILGAAERQRALDAQLAESEAVLIQQCGYLLTAALRDSRLPEVTQARLQKQFSGKKFDPAQLTSAIEEARAEVSALTAGLAIQGPGRVSNMISSVDEYRAALDDLLEAPRDPTMVGKQVRRLSGIREAYLLGTGDVNFHGGYDPLHALQFTLSGTTDFPGIVKDSMNKKLTEAWSKYGASAYGWWKELATVEHFTDLNQVDWIRLGTIGSLPTVAENGEYTELPIGDNVETSDWTKYGGYVELTLEAILRDNIRAFKKMPDNVALGAMRNISEQIAAIFTSNSGAGPTLADTGALFNATAVTTAGGHANLLTTALGTDYTAWEAVASAIYNQPMLVKNTSGYYGIGKKQGLDPKYILVPRALRGAANNLFLSRTIPGVQVPLSSGKEWYGMVVPLTVPEWTDATDWAAAADPQMAPAIMIGEIFGLEPEIYIANSELHGAMFVNDASRIKVRQFLSIGVADFRPLHKSNVAG